MVYTGFRFGSVKGDSWQADSDRVGLWWKLNFLSSHG